MNIFGPPTASFADVIARAKAAGASALFLNEMAPAAWEAAVAHGIDPVVQIAQMAHETGWGTFTGAVRAWFCNPCGLKIRNSNEILGATGDMTLAHSMFASWLAGCTAHAQHLLAYAGRSLNPGEILLDPRWSWVFGRHSVTTVEGLSGKWAPSSTYGDRVLAIVRRLQGV